MWILELFGSAGFGALTGGIFGIFKSFQETRNLEIKQSHQVAMLTAQTDAQVRLADKQIEANKVQGELVVEEQEVKAFTVSQATSSFGHAVKSIIRPLITGCLLYVSYKLTMQLNTLVGGLNSIPAAELAAIYKVVILQIFGLTGMCVGWWFATRNSKDYNRLMDKNL